LTRLDISRRTRSVWRVDTARWWPLSCGLRWLARDESVHPGRAHDWRARVSSNAVRPYPLRRLAWRPSARYARPVTYRDARLVSANETPRRPGQRRHAVP